ncbi:MAG: thioredoxin family protein [Candidatus Riflebacteria bacterium]|nr:thioredoxin family protein [Candidatus Riflebacteria bacterium]
MKILVFGSLKPDCKNCRAAERLVEEIITPWGGGVEYRKVTINSPEAKEFRVMVTPSIVVNGKVVTHGAVPDAGQLRQVLEAERAREAAGS